ncbi:MAG: hypothetical protein MUE44_22255 [Oscillatoriaceae cyanobacterium Prado104]|jgi:hypothetical protein|nr:hypothetical protein [Oscillatoriaceae cyanobacterium Prado104]
MGAMAALFGGDRSDAISSKNEKLTSPTDSKAITPTNPGNFSSIRTTPICDSPRYFNKEEADALKELAKEKTDGAKQAKRAYKAMGQIEEADATVHKAHRGYQKKVASGELKKKRADVGLATHLQGLAPGYARLGMRLEKAETDANTRIEAIKAKLLGGGK